MEIYTAIVLGILGIVGMYIGVKWAQYRSLDPGLVTKKINQYKNYIADLEKENKKLVGKVSRGKQIQKIAVDSIPDDEEGIKNMLDNFLPGFSAGLPKEIGSLLVENKGAIVDFVSKHPEILQRFLTKRGSGEEQTSKTGIPGFDAASAI